jgi:uncharacterized protein (DUF2147 family)
MKKLITILLMLSAAWAYAQKADDILGTWVSEKADAKIEVYKQREKFFGKLVWLKESNLKDDKNPDLKKRSELLIGLVILTDFKFNNSHWLDGEIYDPESGKTYSCVLKLKEGKLDIRGYIGISLFGKSTTWTRQYDLSDFKSN